MSSNFQDWPHKWFGCFAESQEEVKLLPFFGDWVDPNWNPIDKDKLITYLQDGAVCVTSLVPYVLCKFCDRELFDMATWRWDGIWLWPNDLAHNVEFHSLRIPDEMVRSIRALQYYPPTIEKINIEQGKKVLQELKTILKELTAC